jgi:hypothetical protein
VAREMETNVISTQTLQFELEGRFAELGLQTKHHLSVRWEPGPSIVRIGAMIDDYTWDNRMQVIGALLSFESDHADEFAIEFDVFPLEAAKDDEFAEA